MHFKLFKKLFWKSYSRKLIFRIWKSPLQEGENGYFENYWGTSRIYRGVGGLFWSFSLLWHLRYLIDSSGFGLRRLVNFGSFSLHPKHSY